MTASTLPHGRSRYRHQGCRCAVCVEANRLYMRELRARKRGLRPVPGLPRSENSEPGPVVAAVREDVERLGVAESQPALCAAAEQMGRILDNPLLATTQPSACRELLVIMSALHKSAAPRRGKLAAVQAMAGPRRSPDAG